MRKIFSQNSASFWKSLLFKIKVKDFYQIKEVVYVWMGIGNEHSWPQAYVSWGSGSSWILKKKKEKLLSSDFTENNGTYIIV